MFSKTDGGTERNSTLSSLRVARIGIFAALYAVTSVIPISIFIGASSMLGLNIVITPTIAVLLDPFDAGVTAVLGAIVALWVAPYQAIFGLTTVILPLMGALVGSMVYHNRRAGIVLGVAFLSIAVGAYLTARGSFPYWVAPHVLAVLAMFLMPFSSSGKVRVTLSCFVSTMAEQAAMLNQAVYILELPAAVFALAFPLMLYERAVGTFGGSLVVLGVKKITSLYNREMLADSKY